VAGGFLDGVGFSGLDWRDLDWKIENISDLLAVEL
jgi:hypothetical protein|tara:strand:+ start:300 stop:404 length:105 start_codon:yes stop_codon:yes gene_type:complete